MSQWWKHCSKSSFLIAIYRITSQDNNRSQNNSTWKFIDSITKGRWSRIQGIQVVGSFQVTASEKDSLFIDSYLLHYGEIWHDFIAVIASCQTEIGTRCQLELIYSHSHNLDCKIVQWERTIFIINQSVWIAFDLLSGHQNLTASDHCRRFSFRMSLYHVDCCWYHWNEALVASWKK